MSRKLLVVASALACAAVVLFVADRSLAEESLAEQKIERALDKPTTLEFRDTPLSDVVDYLKELHDIEIQTDIKALDDVGIGTDTPVTRNLKGVSLRSALNLMLRDLELTYTIQGEVLLITTPDEAESQLLTKVYDVADLVVTTYRDQTGRHWEREDHGTLVKVITTSTAPNTWEKVGGPGSIAAGTFGSARVIVISQTYQIHREIVKLLEDLRKVAAKSPEREPPLRMRHRGMGMGMEGGMGMDGYGAAPKPTKTAKPEPKNKASRKPAKKAK